MSEAGSLTTSDRLSDYFVPFGNSATRGEKSIEFPKQPRREIQKQETITVGSTEIAGESSWLAAELDHLEALRSVPADWESGGACPPNAAAIGTASTILIKLAESGLQPSHIDPSSDEGICVSFRNGKRYADIECFNSGEVLAVTSTDDGESTVWEVPRRMIQDAISRISRFID